MHKHSFPNKNVFAKVEVNRGLFSEKLILLNSPPHPLRPSVATERPSVATDRPSLTTERPSLATEPPLRGDRTPLGWRPKDPRRRPNRPSAGTEGPSLIKTNIWSSLPVHPKPTGLDAPRSHHTGHQPRPTRPEPHPAVRAPFAPYDSGAGPGQGRAARVDVLSLATSLQEVSVLSAHLWLAAPLCLAPPLVLYIRLLRPP